MLRRRLQNNSMPDMTSILGKLFREDTLTTPSAMEAEEEDCDLFSDRFRDTRMLFVAFRGFGVLLQALI
jgi:hypothetical protein